MAATCNDNDFNNYCYSLTIFILNAPVHSKFAHELRIRLEQNHYEVKCKLTLGSCV